MKLKKINKEFMDLYYKKKLIAMEFDEESGKIYLTDSYKLFVIKFEDFIFRFDLFREVSLKHFLDDSNYVDGVITNGLYTSNKVDLRIINSKDGLINIKVNNKYLEFFDNPEIKVKDEKSPVLIYENGECVGLILPVMEY